MHVEDYSEPTHSFDNVSLGRPESSAHPRFPQHLQMTAASLNEQHRIFHPALKVHFGHCIYEPFIPEAAQILRFKIHEDIVAAARTVVVVVVVVVLPQHHGERGR